MYRTVPFLLVILTALPASGDPAEIVAADADFVDEGWRFSVTLRHDDSGWDDYADGWRVETAEGVVLGTRELLHPHVDEQPFTRSLGGVSVPDGVTTLFIRARTSVTGWDAPRFEIDLR